MRQIITSSLFLLLGFIQAQDFTPLMEKAWANNQQLKSKNFQLASAMSSVEEAKAMYGPTVTFNSQYTLAVGGRAIEFPIGDLLNPVYNTLNDLTTSNKFNTVENANFTFLPNNFYDSKFRIQQAIYMPDLAINKALKEGQLKLKELEIKAYKRMLSKEVMTAYINIEQAKALTEILLSSGELLNEALRTTQSMITNGVALPSARLRVEAQQADLLSQSIDARNKVDNAKRYLAYLVGDTTSTAILSTELPTLGMDNQTIREEILQLDQAGELLSLSVKKEDQFYKPRLGALLDLGSQAFNFGWSPYALLGINFEINLFDNKRHKIRKDAANADIEANYASKIAVQDQFNLKKDISYNNLKTAIDQANTFVNRLTSVDRNYKDVFTKYKAGTAGYLEIIDAQNLVTSTKIQHALAKYNAWTKWAEYVYDTAAIEIK